MTGRGDGRSGENVPIWRLAPGFYLHQVHKNRSFRDSPPCRHCSPRKSAKCCGSAPGVVFPPLYQRGGGGDFWYRPAAEIPPPPLEAVKKFRQGEIGGPGDARGKEQIHAAKTGAGFSAVGVVFKPLKRKRESGCIYKNIPKLPASLDGSGGSASPPSISRRVLAG
jgi:hypothetical protein